MNKKQVYEYGSLYHPYNKQKGWIDWFVNVAPIKVERSLKLLTKYKKRRAKVLDYGCGIGFNMYYFAKVFPDVIGVDNDKQSIEIARKQLKKLGCNKKVLHYNGKILPFRDNTFDIVNVSDVWEHAANPRLMLREIHRVMKSDAILYITNPNKLWPLETHYKLLLLSYLPYPIANWYVRIMKRADRYDDIHLPTYWEFKKSLEEFFTVNDLTFEFVREYKKYDLDKERGMIIPLMGNFLQTIQPLKKTPALSVVHSSIIRVLNILSVGWIFIGFPKKEESV